MRALRRLPVLIALAPALGAAPACSDPESVSPPILSVSPPAIEFGVAEIGAAQRRVRLEMTNAGDGALGIRRFALESATAEIRAEAAPATIGARESVSVALSYAPADEGEDAATLVVEADDGQGPISIPVTGRGARLGAEVVIPAGAGCGAAGSISFGETTAGSPVRRTLTVRSTGTGPIELGAARFEPPAEDFRIDPATLERPLDAGSEQVFTVTYDPKDSGADRVALVIPTNAFAAPELRVDLCAMGASPEICVGRTEIDFGLVIAGTSSTAAVSIESCGAMPLELRALALGDGPLGPLSPELMLAAPAAPVTLMPGASVTATVSITAPPGGTGNKTGRLRIMSNAPAALDVSIPVAARVDPPCAFVTTPNLIRYFPNGAVERRILISNMDLRTCHLTRAAIATGAGSFSFVAQPSLPLAIDAGASALLLVAYTPSAPGAVDRGSVEISLDRGPIRTVDLVGAPSAAGCNIEALPSFLSFGGVAVGARRAESVEIRNVGGSPCTLSNTRMTPETPPDFVLTPGTVPPMLAPGGLATVTVDFVPRAAGISRGALLIDTSDFDVQTLRLPLDGTGSGSGLCDGCRCPSDTTLTYHRWVAAGTSVVSSENDSLLVRTCEPAQRCTTSGREVAVEVAPDVYVCEAEPRPCTVAGEELAYGPNGWDCVDCPMIVQFGGIYAGERVCAERPDVTCSTGKTPTFDVNLRDWVCAPTCNNGQYDRFTMDDGTLVCVPC